MKLGKVSQTVEKRSILKQIQWKREESILGPAIEEMCAGIKVQSGYDVIYTTETLYGNEKDLGVFAIAKAVNNLASRGAEPIGVSVCISLPDFAYESRLKAMVVYMEETCRRHNLELQAVKAEVLPVLTSTIVGVTAIGTVKAGEVIQTAFGHGEQDVVLVGWIGLEGTLRVLREKEEALKQRFIPAFLKQAADLKTELFSIDAIDMARKAGARCIHQIGSGGILATLWEMAEACDVGLTIEQKKLSVKQETIEICEFFRLNPYQLTSTGSLLIMVDNGKTLVRQLDEAGIYAEIIGRTTRDCQRVIVNGEEKRFLDRPQPDELTKIFSVGESTKVQA